jgi:hypothetical protein
MLPSGIRARRVDARRATEFAGDDDERRFQ